MHDIHCHLIYGVDDGAIDIEDTLNMCRSAVKDNIKHIVATPHYMKGISTVSYSVLREKIQVLNNRLKQENISLTILPGMEVYMDPGLVDLYEKGDIITLNNKKYMLIEFSVYGGVPSYLDHIIFDLQLKGIRPIIAHPERYRPVIKDPNIACSLIDKGCLLQMNSGSIEGIFGRDVQKTAHKLLKHNMVHVISTDNHSSHGRMSQFRDCYRQVLKKYGGDTARDLFVNNPRKIINGEDITIKEPAIIKKSKFW